MLSALSSPHQSGEVDIVCIIPILQMRKLRAQILSKLPRAIQQINEKSRVWTPIIGATGNVSHSGYFRKEKSGKGW